MLDSSKKDKYKTCKLQTRGSRTLEDWEAKGSITTKNRTHSALNKKSEIF
jgi:hypothetical protein